jgi:hypothetical protein
VDAELSRVEIDIDDAMPHDFAKIYHDSMNDAIRELEVRQVVACSNVFSLN